MLRLKGKQLLFLYSDCDLLGFLNTSGIFIITYLDPINCYEGLENSFAVSGAPSSAHGMLLLVLQHT